MPPVTAAEPGRPLRLQDILSLMQPRQGPCVSIYLPTTTDFTRADEMRLRFRALVDEAETSLQRMDLRRPEIESLLSELRSLEGDMGFWRAHALAGVAAFRSPQEFVSHRLLAEPPALAVVAESFHVKPLVRIVQDGDRYHVLCLSRKNAALFEGNRYRLERVAIEGLEREPEESIRGEPTVARTTASGPETGGIWNDQAAIRKHFRRVDDAIWQHHSREADLPLILAALPEAQTLFREVSKNDYLVDERIERDPFHDMTLEELQALSWEAVQPVHQRGAAALVDAFNEARAHDQASDDRTRIARAAWEGRVATLLLEADKRLGGRVDPGTGELKLGDIADPDTDDALDDMAEMVLRAGGRVLVLPAERMPARSGAAAIERYRVGAS